MGMQRGSVPYDYAGIMPGMHVHILHLIYLPSTWGTCSYDRQDANGCMARLLLGLARA
jgi:hypothetical protein